MKNQLILFVDDEWANRVVFEQSFGSRFRVRVAASGKEALEWMEQEPVAVLLTDQRMPEMAGEELLAQVKARFPHTVRVMITAYSDLDPILRAVNEGLVARYIIKPWDRAELEQIIRWGIAAFELGQQESALQLRLMQTERLATLGSIGAAMLHDLHRPLSHFMLNAERLAQLAPSREAITAGPVDELAAELPEIARDLLASGHMMVELTGQLRRFYQSSPIDEPTTATPVFVIRHALSVCREVALHAKAKLFYDGPESLPELCINPTGLTQIFINLVSNGAQALRSESRRDGHVTVSAQIAPTEVLFTIADNGSGIPDEILSKVGTPFFSTRRDGSGLGISQCRRLVERAGGELRIESAVGVGTIVSFALARCDAGAQ